MKRLDWRFLTCLIGLVLSVAAAYSVAESAREARENDAHIEALIAANHDLRDAAERDREAAAAERETASRERTELLAGQRTLEAQYAALVARQGALLRYLRNHGIDVPLRFITVPQLTTPSAPQVTPRRGLPGAGETPSTTKPGKGKPGKGQSRRPRGSAKRR